MLKRECEARACRLDCGGKGTTGRHGLWKPKKRCARMCNLTTVRSNGIGLSGMCFLFLSHFLCHIKSEISERGINYGREKLLPGGSDPDKKHNYKNNET